MRLDRMKEQAIAQRKGSTGRTILQVIWFIICFTVAYYAVDWLVANRYISYRLLYRGGVPEYVPQWALQVFLMLLVVTAMQIFLFIGSWAENVGIECASTKTQVANLPEKWRIMP